MRSIRRLAAWLPMVASLSCGGAGGTEPVSPADGTPATVSINPPSSTISIGAQLPLQALVQDPDGRLIPVTAVVWSAQDPAIASVSGAGVVTAVALGSTQVAASYNGRSAVATITVQKTPVASVVVTPGQASAVVGAKVPFGAAAFDAAQNRLADRAVVWSSSDLGVATVDATGTATAMAPGTATISAVSEGKTATATLSVSAGPVAEVAVTPTPVSLTIGQKTFLAATARDASGGLVSGRAFVWSSSNTSVAIVSEQGEVTGIGAGSTTITATSEGKSGTAQVTVSTIPAASVEVSPRPLAVTVGSSATVTATVRGASGNVLPGRAVEWSSSDSDVARVNNAGVVTGVSAGSATITAATSDGRSGSTQATVTNVPVASVELSPSAAPVTVGSSTTLTATLRDADGRPLTRNVTWTSDNSAVASVSNTGVVTGVSPGSATITAASEGRSASARITVSEIAVANVAVSPPTASLTVGSSTTISAAAKDAAGSTLPGRAIAWSSSDAGIATVSASGVVTGVSAGSATISATSGDATGTTRITVTNVPVASVAVSPGTASLNVGSTTTLSATPKDAGGNTLAGRAVSWSSDNLAVATVSNTGVVTGVLPGSANVTATSEGRSGSAAVTVTLLTVPPPPTAPVAARVTVTPKTRTLNGNQSVTITATAVDAGGNPITGRNFTWTTSLNTTSTDAPSFTLESRGLRDGLVVTVTATLDRASDSSTIRIE